MNEDHEQEFSSYPVPKRASFLAGRSSNYTETVLNCWTPRLAVRPAGSCMHSLHAGLCWLLFSGPSAHPEQFPKFGIIFIAHLLFTELQNTNSTSNRINVHEQAILEYFT